jgi:hypothetical protein
VSRYFAALHLNSFICGSAAVMLARAIQQRDLISEEASESRLIAAKRQ